MTPPKTEHHQVALAVLKDHMAWAALYPQALMSLGVTPRLPEHILGGSP